jgi:hypothetical protein
LQVVLYHLVPGLAATKPSALVLSPFEHL